MAFVYPKVLWGLLLLLIPIIVHLFQFRRYRVQYFSNTRFLSALNKQTHRQSQLKKLLILSLRMLTIICLVLAFAKPYLPAQNDKNVSKQNMVYIYIDNSFSMENESQNGNLFNEAKTQAKALVDAFAETDMFMLLTNDIELKHQQVFAKQDIKKEIDDLKISPRYKTLSEIYAYMSQNAHSNCQQGCFYLFSDFQTTMANFGQIRQDSLFDVFLVPMKASQINNISIDSVWILSPNLTIGQNIDVYCSISNQADKDVEQVPIKLFVDNRQKAITSMDIKANTTVVCKLNLTLDSNQWQAGCIKIMDNLILFDNQCYFSLFVNNKIHVLHCYKGKGNKYIEQLFAHDSSVVFSEYNINAINYQDLATQQLLIVDADNDMSDGFIHEMEQYLNNGGNVLLLPVNQYNDNKINNRLTITTWGNLTEVQTKFDKLNLQHPLLENVFEAYPENIELPLVSRYFELNKTIGKNKETLITLENNADFLTCEQYGKGYVFVLAAPLTEDYTDFMKHAIFVPMLYNMTVVSNKDSKLYYTIGNNELINLDNHIANDNVLELTDNNKQTFIPELIRYNGHLWLDVHDNVKENAVLILQNKQDTLDMLAFNFNRNESVMQFLFKEDLSYVIDKYQLSNFSILDIQHKNVRQIQSQMAIDSHKGIQVFLILLGLVFLLLESIFLRVFSSSASFVRGK